MKLEIVLLLLAGFTPKKVAKLLNMSLGNIYHYNRKLKKAKKNTEELMEKLNIVLS